MLYKYITGTACYKITNILDVVFQQYFTLNTIPQMVVPVLRAAGVLDPNLVISASKTAFLKKI